MNCSASRNTTAQLTWLPRLPSGVIIIANYYPHKRACQGDPFLLFAIGDMYLKFHRSWNKWGPINSRSCSSKHFVKVYAVLAQVTGCEFTQRLLHSAPGNINHFKEDINDTILVEVITIVLMWTCSSILNLLNPMPGQMWNWRILHAQLLFSAMHIYQSWISYFRTQGYSLCGDIVCTPRWGNEDIAIIITRRPIFPLKKSSLFF